MEYLSWNETQVTDFAESNISQLYDRGYVFTRIAKGTMQQTRSARINLTEFEPTSENRRILRKGETAGIKLIKHPIPYADYSWEIGKLAKDFYETKAGGAFSANKIREILTNDVNFNTLLEFKDTENLGYVICYENPAMLHYSYPFYNIEKNKDLGLIMMLTTIVDAKSRGLTYVYLGSLQRSSDTYKLQLPGIEWFDGEKWQTDVEAAKKVLADTKTKTQEM